MELCLTGRMMDAAEAERAGLVARVVPADKLLEEPSPPPKPSPATRCRWS
jgi:enoyl-CoA hydratase/carnithine racemase